jgi:hypothetical protein
VESGVRRVEVPRAFAVRHDQRDPSLDYASAFALPLEGPAMDPLTAEQWARVVFEGAPRLLRSCILFGWRVVLGLRLQPLDAADQVLGWRIERVPAGPDVVTLAADSRLLRAENIVAVDGTVVLWVTTVHPKGRVGRLLWDAASIVHHQTIPYLLGRAGRGQACRERDGSERAGSERPPAPPQ